MKSYIHDPLSSLVMVSWSKADTDFRLTDTFALPSVASNLTTYLVCGFCCERQQRWFMAETCIQSIA